MTRAANDAIAKSTSPHTGRDSDPDVTLTLESLTLALAALGNQEGATMSAILADPSVATGEIAERYSLGKRAVQATIAKARAKGLIEGSSGAWVPVLPHPTHAGLPDSSRIASRRLADRAREAEANALTHGGVRYASHLERDVAVVLASQGVAPRRQVPYTQILPGCNRQWTADFFSPGGGTGPATVIEVTSERPHPDRVETLRLKRAACEAAGIAYVEVVTTDGMVEAIRVARAGAAARASAPISPAPRLGPDGLSETYRAGDCHVVRRGTAGYRPTPPAPPPEDLLAGIPVRPYAPTTEDLARSARAQAEERAEEAARQARWDAWNGAKLAYRQSHPEYVQASAAVAMHEEAEIAAAQAAAAAVARALEAARSRPYTLDLATLPHEAPRIRSKVEAPAPRSEEAEAIAAWRVQAEALAEMGEGPCEAHDRPGCEECLS